jgi:hypothetical protein
MLCASHSCSGLIPILAVCLIFPMGRCKAANVGPTPRATGLVSSARPKIHPNHQDPPAGLLSVRPQSHPIAPVELLDNRPDFGRSAKAATTT